MWVPVADGTWTIKEWEEAASIYVKTEKGEFTAKGNLPTTNRVMAGEKRVALLLVSQPSQLCSR